MKSPNESEIESWRQLKRDGKTNREIAEDISWNHRTVAKHTSDVTKKWKDIEWLREHIRERGMTCREVAEKLPVGEATVSKWRNKHDILHEWEDEETLRRLYHKEGMALPEMANRWDMVHAAVRRQMIVNGIERREPAHGSPGDSLAANGHYGEKWKEVRQEALDRDNSTCQREGCDESGDGLDVHHMKPVNSFDDPEDAHFLANLVTLCRSHHKEAENNICPSTEGI